VNPELPEEAVAFGAAATKAFADLGGVDAARRAELEPGWRATEVAGTLAALGIADLDPRTDPESLAAAAALCEAAGRVVLPFPVAGVLLVDADGRPLAVVGGSGRLRVDHGDLFPEWRTVSVAGTAGTATPSGGPLGTRLGPFVTDLVGSGPGDGAQSAPAATADVADVARHLTLVAAQVLGTVGAAVEAAADHVTGRVQFGKPLAAFQTIQFQLADAAVAVSGLRELVHFTLWRLTLDPAAALVDALAARVHALDVARAVLRTTQQFHGAAGVCDEYDVSVLSRHVQPALRLPFGAERTADALAAAIARDGFEGLFPHGAGVA
jgi:hypothetical protein